MKVKFKIDYKGLEDYLRSINYYDIETYGNRDTSYKLINATAMDDIEFFKMNIAKIPSDSIVDYGEPFLVDVLGNDLTIVMLTRRRYKMPNGRIIRAKFIATVIDDCRNLYGNVLNGYWKIPSQFVSNIE
jgi:hypothetical protein